RNTETQCHACSKTIFDGATTTMTLWQSRMAILKLLQLDSILETFTIFAQLHCVGNGGQVRRILCSQLCILDHPNCLGSGWWSRRCLIVGGRWDSGCRIWVLIIDRVLSRNGCRGWRVDLTSRLAVQNEHSSLLIERGNFSFSVPTK